MSCAIRIGTHNTTELKGEVKEINKTWINGTLADLDKYTNTSTVIFEEILVLT